MVSYFDYLKLLFWEQLEEMVNEIYLTQRKHDKLRHFLYKLTQMNWLLY